MTTPTKSAYDAAMATVLAGDAVMLQAASAVFEPVIAANNTAIAALDDALATYSPSPGGGMSRAYDAIQGWRNQLAAFSSTFDALNAAAAGMLPSAEDDGDQAQS